MNEPIAIVGMAGRFPGADDIDALWELLDSGGTAIDTVPVERWDVQRPLGGGKRVPTVGGFIGGVAEFDAALFGISPREAADLDPQQRLMLEIAWRALEDAGTPGTALRGTRTGVYVGASWHDYDTLRTRGDIGPTQHSLVGTALDMIPARLSYLLGLTGPSMAVQTGCSSALVALDLAVRALRSGDVESAVVGGVTLVLGPDVTIGLTHFGGLSPRGRCAAFGAGADGFVRGEGVAAVYLKPLRTALRDGDRVRALVTATVTNNDGGGESLVTPHGAGQRDLLRRAYAAAGVDLDRLAYLEAHGTGTGRGDPIEAEAIGEVLGRPRSRAAGPLRIGSIKTNIGHLEAASGIAGLIKGVLCLEHGTIPPSLHAAELNPDIDFDALNVTVVRERTPLPAGPIHLGVNSFGWGGTNAHAVLSRAESVPAPAASGTDPGFLPLSAHTTEALDRRCADIADLLTTRPGELSAVAAALARRSHQLDRRTAIFADEADSAVALLRRCAAGATDDRAVLTGRAREVGRVAFIFPGQGAQWHGLGAALYGVDPAFTATIDECAAALASQVDWDPLAVIRGASGPDWLDRVDQVQPVLWALTLGIGAMWRRMGIVPDLVVGHSQGEIAAATFAGALTIADGALVVARRSAALRAVAGSGAMLAVELPAAEIPACIAGFEDSVTLAVHNGPTSCVLAGDSAAIEVLHEILSADGIFSRPVAVDYASHSPHMEPLRPGLATVLADVRPGPAPIEMLSTVTGRPCAPEELDATYWIENLCRPVRFADTMLSALDSGVTHVIEISPHPVLTPALEQLAATRPQPAVVVPSLYRDRDPVAELRRSRARAYLSGLSPFADVARSATITLPPGPMQRGSFWLPDAPTVGADADGLRVPVYPSVAESGVWQANISLSRERQDWLEDHRVGDAVVVPAAFMTSFATAVAHTRYGRRPAALYDIRFTSALPLSAAPARLDLTLREDVTGGASFELRSLPAGGENWTVHAVGRVGYHAGHAPAPELSAPVAEKVVEVDEFYRACAERGLNYGPEFRGVRAIRRTDLGVRAEVVLGERSRAQTRPGELHTVLADCALQPALLLFDDPRTVVPVGIRELLLYPEPAEFVDAAQVYAVRTSDTTADIDLFDPAGTPLAAIRGLALAAIDPAPSDGRRFDREFRFVLRQGERPAPAEPGADFVLAGAAAWHPALAEALRARGARIRDTGTALERGTLVYCAPTTDLADQRTGLLTVAEVVRALTNDGAAPARLVVVTAAAQPTGPDDDVDPGSAMFWGFVRALRREHPELSATLIDIGGASDIGDCAAELVAMPGDDQVVLREGRRYAGRLAQGEALGGARSRPWRPRHRPFRLRQAAERGWDGLHFAPLPERRPGPGEVLVDIAAAAVNFIDVMKAAGTYPDDSAGAGTFGAEGAGAIRAIGPGVSGRAVGDRVIACGSGTFATQVVVRADHTEPIPAGLPDTTAAALPLVYTTAWYALATLARVTPGERVLIHSGTGGLGLAAIAVARYLGATVLATAGSPARRDYLRRELGIADVFDSRGAVWADEVLAATGGGGVDVVLNSLSGAHIDRGLDVLAEDGRFLEVGKKDIYANRRLGSRAFAKGISFTAVDLAGLLSRRPERFATALHETWQLVAAGALPALPVEVHPFAAAPDVLRRMARGDHIGKFVLDRPETVVDIVPEAMPDGRFRADGTYLVTGGHGALGRSLTRWLLERGAGCVVALSRTGNDGEIPLHQFDLEPAGLTGSVHSRRVDVADRNALAAVLDSLRPEVPPVRGVFHAAGILDDSTVRRITADQLERVLRPKVDGARHLDELTAGDPLDLFVLFSSAAALLGNAGQAAYSAANSYLDAFAVSRRWAGRPATSVQWGPFAGIGLAAAQDNRGNRLAAAGMDSFTAAEAWAALTEFLGEDRQVVAYLCFDARRWFDTYPDCAAQPSWEALRDNAHRGNGPAASEFRSALAAAGEPDRPNLVLGKIVELAAGVLRLPPQDLDIRTPLRSLGLDSLMSLELRNKLESTFALRLSPTVLWTYGTAEALAGALTDEVAAS
ncbi:type I polyketide synthase [Nocardia stercoris]|uniref:SDR family NAD(P)-dependent oxidoreductase n=1 Tax=Nocardia stercoris TaxID=2483361 RepID=A0A3M2L7S8_9NOCA|nr:type I polyketide synthase [Nocardia stercoris]RMI32613.1 SDR family NAD(P)-dependent oxidoreductase [Nocardia stercoris]